MFLNGSFLNFSFFKDITTIQPQAYYGIKFFGDCIIDNVHILKKKLTDKDVSLINPIDRPKWDKDTLLLATFDNVLDAGNVDSGLGTIEKWLLYRKSTTNSKLEKVAELNADEVVYNDLKLKLGESYSYQIFPQTSTQIGTPASTEVKISNSDAWVLIDENTKESFKFGLNLTSSDILTNTKTSEYITNNKYPTVDFSDVNYISGSIECMGGTVDENNNYIGDSIYIEKLTNFINNNNEKILKSTNGMMWRVVTKNFSFNIIDETIEKAFNMRFDFMEVGDV